MSRFIRIRGTPQIPGVENPPELKKGYVCECSVFDAGYRAKLNELSEAEDALSRAVSDDI
ncbi:hypothetical protein Ab1vBOLIVR4_gp49 [Agrobacterium phage OLIVR4]|nr:hypothetical protein Ab1vBOLIVR4_gp49 [Agrobacterium phage OLIVR4]